MRSSRSRGYFKYYGADSRYAMELRVPPRDRRVRPLRAQRARLRPARTCRADELLQIFLEVDKEAEGEQQEPSLRGVRKAQVKLATYYLQQGRRGARARRSTATCATSGPSGCARSATSSWP